MWKDAQWNHLVTLPPEKSSWTAWTPLNQLSGAGEGEKKKVFWIVNFPQTFILIHQIMFLLIKALDWLKIQISEDTA